jgi:hypothetical protein
MKKKILLGLSVLVFGALGAGVGSAVASITAERWPILDEYWGWLGPLVGIVVNLAILRFIYYANQHPSAGQ